MNAVRHIHQNPAPGSRHLFFRGDTVTFDLTVSATGPGAGWIRTNIGQAAVIRREIIDAVDRRETPLARDWFDIRMKPLGGGRFTVTLALCETGHFEGKCFFLPEGESEPVWPAGGNVELNVGPAHTCCGNIIYNAFVRQFGPNKNGRLLPASLQPAIGELDTAGYAVIPPSGTFRDLIGELDFIIGRLGCRIIQLLPVHPTPTTYGRMGRFGSPYAALSFTDVDPALAEFDPRATPLDQFIELVDAVHQRHGLIFIDIAINHTGWAASLHETHPRWLARTENGEIEMPGAWGVTWADLTRLDYRHQDLWQYMARIFTTWCHRGVDGFRCDAGYMIPIAAWRYIIATVREAFPDTVFMLEGLGGKISVTRELLNTGGFDWAYSELFQNYDRGQVEAYLPEALSISQAEGAAVHFAETHDNNRLAATSAEWAGMRTLLCALVSTYGAFGFANGVEWLATEKIDVHEASSLNWGHHPNLVESISRVNRLLRRHPAFWDRTTIRMVQRGEGTAVAVLRHHEPTGKRLLILVNLSDRSGSPCRWDIAEAGMAPGALVDLLTGQSLSAAYEAGGGRVDLAPGQVLCLSPDPGDMEIVPDHMAADTDVPERIARQQLRAKALEVFHFFRGQGHLEGVDSDAAAAALGADPVRFCRSLNPHGEASCVIRWQWPRDLRREVMVPPGHFLWVTAPSAFRARIDSGDRVRRAETSFRCTDYTHAALFSPLPTPAAHMPCTLKLSVFDAGGCRHDQGPLLFLSSHRRAAGQVAFNRDAIVQRNLLMLGTNGRGGMLRAHVRWGILHSRYDALLAGNLHPEIPENRQIMLARCRAWLVYQGYSQEIDWRCIHRFTRPEPSTGIWDFRILTGQGEHVRLRVGLEMTAGENGLHLVFCRRPAAGGKGRLTDAKPVKLIVRPDIEDRLFHDTTKAYTGPEKRFPESVTHGTDAFSFGPAGDRRLDMEMPGGRFVWEPEWHYMVHRQTDAERGLDPDSDLFSPGYFFTHLTGDREAVLTARIATAPAAARLPETRLGEALRQTPDRRTARKRDPLPALLNQALDAFVVRRGSHRSVIAGYPWFLDWGRDSLIVARGLIAADRLEEARHILEQFGRFEKNGTLPNMIQGQDAGNRDTSDAPLWFAVACADLAGRTADTTLFDAPCGQRTFRQVIRSIGLGYVGGTPNGIRMDPETGLIFSPAHFTWMDTNHPAGTPRQGYPIEIQALWYATLRLLAEIDTGKGATDWPSLANRVRTAINDLFWIDEAGYLADCLHGPPASSAVSATADDALRPNQIFALTFGAITDADRCRRLLDNCQELLVPGAIRSLADRKVGKPLAIWHNGQRLNDPEYPYRGRYEGDEDTRRKPAYHNGTAWTWPFPAFCEAWAQTYGPAGKKSALNWLGSATRLLNNGCIGQLPEIVDGDAPHRQRGCDAQAWGVSELLRVWLKLTGGN